MIKRVMENTKEQVLEEQGGFRTSVVCIYEIFPLKQLVEKLERIRRRCTLHLWT